jgi:hypothetical protein
MSRRRNIHFGRSPRNVWGFIMVAKSRSTGPADPARGLLAGLLGSDGLTIVAEQSTRTPDGRLLRRVYGAVTDRPNTSAGVVVDEAGAEVDLAAAERAAGRRLFVPSVGGLDVPVPVREPVTIDPSVNDLVLAECAHLAERITVTIPPSGAAPKADVYLLADTTFSMEPILEAVKGGAAAIVTALAGFDVAYGVGNYRDFPIAEGTNSYAFQPQLAPTKVLADIQAAVDVWTAAEGSDGSEGQLWALQQIATDPAIGWRPDAKRIVVWFGDAPGHDPVCTAITGAAEDVTEATATAALAAASITVVAVSTNTSVPFFPLGLDDDPTKDAGDYGVCTVGGTSGQGTRITGATGGSLVNGVDATQVVAVLADLIAAAVTTTGEVHLQPTGAIAGFVTSITPPGYGPLAGDEPHALPFDVVWDGTVECAEQDQVFTGTLDVVADGVVVAAKAVRITVPACRLHHVVDMLCGAQRGAGHDGESDDKGRDRCLTVVPGRYATAVTIYNPGPCRVVVEKRFAPLLLNGEAVGREPRVQDAKTFARIELEPGQATMDDCCALEEVVRLDHGTPTLGMLDLVSDGPLAVTAVYTSTGVTGGGGATVHTRTITPQRV